MWQTEPHGKLQGIHASKKVLLLWHKEGKRGQKTRQVVGGTLHYNDGEGWSSTSF